MRKLLRSWHVVLGALAFATCLAGSAQALKAEASMEPHCEWTFDGGVNPPWHCWDVNCSEAGGGFCAGDTEEDCYCVLPNAK